MWWGWRIKEIPHAHYWNPLHWSTTYAETIPYRTCFTSHNSVTTTTVFKESFNQHAVSTNKHHSSYIGELWRWFVLIMLIEHENDSLIETKFATNIHLAYFPLFSHNSYIQLPMDFYDDEAWVYNLPCFFLHVSVQNKYFFTSFWCRILTSNYREQCPTIH